MAHLAFVFPPFEGHLAPACALAGALVARGHRATFVGIADAEGLVDGARFGFRAVGAASHPPGHLAAMTQRMGRVTGLMEIGGIIRDVVAATDMLARELPEALREIGADLVVCDGTEAAGGLAAEHLGLPFVTLAAALPLNRDPAVPPPFTGWGYDPSRWGLERNAGGYRVSDWLMRSHAAAIAEHAARLGLPARSTLEACLSPLAQISQIVPGLDFPRTELPGWFHYCGPLREEAVSALTPAAPPDNRARSTPLRHAEEGRAAACLEARTSVVRASRRGLRPLLSMTKGGSRADALAARPRSYATLGTLQGGRLSLFRRIAEAGRRLGLDLVISHGGALGPEQVARLGAADVRAWVSQPEVLDGAAVAIVNGGLNTVMDALAAGVPVVVLPIAFEQAAIAARLAHAEAGRAVSPRFLTAGRLAHIIGAVLTDPDYAAAARGLADEVAAAGGVLRAADIVERVLATGRPVFRDDVAGHEPPILWRRSA